MKYRPELEAYTEGREFFLKHNEYTHLIICPDDLIVRPEDIEQLIEDVKELDVKVISGICNIDETQMDTYAIQPLGCDFTKPIPTHYGAWYMKPTLPDDDIFQVGHSGFACQIIERDVMESISWDGITGNFDWQFSKECAKLGIKIWVDKRVNMMHLRQKQNEQAKKISGDGSNGYSVWIQDRN